MEKPKQENKTVQKPRLSGGQLLVVALLGAGLGILGTLYAQDLIEVITPVALTVLLTLFAVGVLLYLAITFYRDKIIRYLFGEDIHFDSALTDAQDMVKQTIIGTTEAIPGLDPSKKKQLQQAAPRMANYLIWSRFRSQGLRMMIGFMVAIGGLATTILLFNQNQLLERQNEKIDMQLSLEESNRRSAMMSQMANVLDKIDEELRDTFNSNHGTRRLSEQLIGRISALSEGLLPYRYLDGNSLSKELSPERGQLLLAIVNSGLDTNTLSKIYSRTTFRRASLRYASLERVFLKKVDLGGADLTGAFLHKVNLRGAFLDSVIFDNAGIYSTDLSNTILWKASFRRLNRNPTTGKMSEIISSYDRYSLMTPKGINNIDSNRVNKGEFGPPNISFQGADLVGSVFTGALLRNCNFVNSYISYSLLIDTDLSYSRLADAQIRYTRIANTKFDGADLENADFCNTYLKRVHFSNASLKGAYFDHSIFSDCIDLNFNELSQTTTLYKSKGIKSEWILELKAMNSELFEYDDLSDAWRQAKHQVRRPSKTHY